MNVVLAAGRDRDGVRARAVARRFGHDRVRPDGECAGAIRRGPDPRAVDPQLRALGRGANRDRAGASAHRTQAQHLGAARVIGGDTREEGFDVRERARAVTELHLREREPAVRIGLRRDELVCGRELAVRGGIVTLLERGDASIEVDLGRVLDGVGGGRCHGREHADRCQHRAHLVPQYRARVRTIGHYRLKSLIGSGGTSEVYAAEHTLLGHSAAIKLLRDPAHADALVAEGMNVRAIDHPNVVRVLDAGIDPETQGCYLVMEYIRGETLAARLERGPLPEPAVRRLGAELADAIAAAHARGIVHRDLKPANVMLDGERPKIVDFGIAKHLGDRSAVTTGRVIGTLAYMAPEQLASGLIAPCTDVWALGVILFEALTGRLPFDSFADGRFAQLADHPLRASAITTVSPELDAIIARCLGRDPAVRPSAADVAAMLRGERAIVEDERVTVDAGPLVPAPSMPVAQPQRRRRGIVLGATVTAAAAAAAIVIAFVFATDGSASVAANAVDGAVAATGDRDGAVVAIPEHDAAPALPPDAAPEKPPQRSRIVVRSRPAGARVLVGGTLRGLTPLELELELPGTIVVERAGYRASRVRVDEAGPLDVTLKRARRVQRRKETLD